MCWYLCIPFNDFRFKKEVMDLMVDFVYFLFASYREGTIDLSVMKQREHAIGERVRKHLLSICRLEEFVPQDVFEEYAEDYDRWFDEHRDEYLGELARIRKVLPPSDSRSIEVGVGSGRFAAPLGVTLGVEPSRALGRMARQRGIEVIRGRAEALPFMNASCSSVLLVTVICYLKDPFPAFRELNRILIPGGFLIVAFIERGGQIQEKYLRESGKGRFLSHAKFYSEEDVRRLLENTGFSVTVSECRRGFCVFSAEKKSSNSF
jgi:SAM-dependent methyltransferase